MASKKEIIIREEYEKLFNKMAAMEEAGQLSDGSKWRTNKKVLRTLKKTAKIAAKNRIKKEKETT